MAIDVDGEDFDPDGPADDGNPFGTPEAELTSSVDVSAYVAQKRAAIAAHAQPGHRHRLLPGDARRGVRHGFGTEWFIEPGVEATGPRPGGPFS